MPARDFCIFADKLVTRLCVRAWADASMRHTAGQRREGELVVRDASETQMAAKLPWAQLRLPPFPQVAMRVLQLAQNENVQLHQLCDLISSDPAFASEVLTVANSVLYSPRYPSSSILQA